MVPDAAAADEEKCLADGMGRLQHNAFYMHRALDSNNLKDALRAFDELRKVEMFFMEETKRGTYSVTDLYELVQHAANILPRL
ncbi:hypothetical protein GW17_00021493 [Ensete ventricosum]|nr:hypothetical protein GW17_00021493 [Ensete ventricosum]RZR84759.1 hypothetical protein BHM03_00011630 [Ensete ventricosum]